MPIGPFFTGDSGGNGIVNLGGLPGIQQGPIAARPAAGVADGVWYLATDDKVLYRWDLASTTWVEELSDGGGGATPPWHDVMNAGNTTTQPAILTNTSNQSIVAMGDLLGLDCGAWSITTPGSAFPFSLAGAGIFAYVETVAGKDITIGFFNALDGWGETTYLGARKNTARRRTWMPDKTGDIVLGASGQVSQVTTAAQTVITIPHGMWPLPDFPTTPTNSTISALDAVTAAVLVGGYWMGYDTTNIYIHLLVAIVGTPTVNIAWTAIV